MNIPAYDVNANQGHTSYEFESIGPKGTIKKIVSFPRFPGYSNVFNLSMGDWDEKQQRVRDDTRSNNDDADKVLATVATTVVDFLHHNPGAMVFASGSTPGRTRLYQMGIATHLTEISLNYEVQGYRNGSWETFLSGNNYEAFTIRTR